MARTNDSRATREATLPHCTTPPSGLAAALDAVVRPAEDGEDPGGVPGSVFVAVVHTVDDVRLVVASTLRDGLLRQLADYVRQRAPDELWPDDVARVRALLAGGEPEAAVAHYFATVGRRWDTEWLVTAHMDAEALVDHVLATQRSRAAGTIYHPVGRERRAAERGR